MSIAKEPSKGNLTISVMFRDWDILAQARTLFTDKFGPIDMESPAYGFSEISPYYDAEMGAGVKKIICSFRELIYRDMVRDAKLFAIDLERKFSKNDARLVNIDPGMITLENFLLTTGKNFSHRVYLGAGVFAEVTLMFSKENAIKELPWTYRDYLLEPARSFLLEARENYRDKLKEIKRIERLKK